MEPLPTKHRIRAKAPAGKARLEARRRARPPQGFLAQVVVRARGTRVGVIPRAGAIRAANDPVA